MLAHGRQKSVTGVGPREPLSLPCSDTGSLIGLNLSREAEWPVNPRDLPVSTSLTLGL